MTTMIAIVTRACRKARLAGTGEALDAELAADGMEALNGMLYEWSLRGVDISHTTKAESDAFPMSAAYEDGAVYMLAERLSPDFNRPSGFDADDFFRAIQAAYMTIASVTFDAALREVPSKQARDGSLGLGD